jgi:hypothetical protein
MPNSTGSCVAMTERHRRSVYEGRELGWRDRLRWLLGHEKRPAPLFDPPRLVVERGRPAGYRCVDGSVLRFPEPPANRPDLWPEEWWGGQDDDGWIRFRRRDWRR